jgi:FtsZ-binding cell division protein ZapB
MTEFTPEWIAKARNACIFFGEPATTEFRKALDHIERLQKRVEELEALNECITDLQIEIDDLKRSRDHWKQTAQHQFRYGG